MRRVTLTLAVGLSLAVASAIAAGAIAWTAKPSSAVPRAILFDTRPLANLTIDESQRRDFKRREGITSSELATLEATLGHDPFGTFDIPIMPGRATIPCPNDASYYAPGC